MNKNYIIDVEYKGNEAKKVFDTLLYKVSPEHIYHLSYKYNYDLEFRIMSSDINFVYKINKEIKAMCFATNTKDDGEFIITIYCNNMLMAKTETKQINLLDDYLADIEC